MSCSELEKKKAGSREMWLVTFLHLSAWTVSNCSYGKSLSSFTRRPLVKSHEKNLAWCFAECELSTQNQIAKVDILKHDERIAFGKGIIQYFKDKSLNSCLCYLVIAFIYYCNWIINNIDFYLWQSLCKALDLQEHNFSLQKASLKWNTVIFQ